MIGTRKARISGKDNKDVKPKTTILWGREDFLANGVEFFLNNQKDWEVIRLTDKRGEESLLREVQRVKPDVVIIHQGDSATDSVLPLQLMQECPTLMVITVNLETNSVEVYNRKKVLVKEVADLLTIVES
jgi:DNA-binding NarL/FixJ family response regulator